ncbi:FecR family protein [Dongia mobilis]|uniref:FecR family protein n=1 Tax=Dongia mobilis TaxID=578943 RepID=A0A4R6WFY1_9PROT|nr:FecR family protein [Dongia mobilis]TDQ78930.1 FecR family protein [Dongia mobilis]
MISIYRRDFLTNSGAALLAAIGAGLGGAGRAMAGTAAGQISRLAGTATILRAGAAIAVVPELPVMPEDRIRTGADSRVEVTFSDGSVLTVGPDSDIAVIAFAPNPEESNAVLELLSGIVRATVNSATGWKRFEVRTTTAVASVRGTDYLVENTGAASAVFVAEGRVAVSSRVGAGTVVIREGQGVDVTAEYTPLAVRVWGAKRRDAALARVTFP